MSYQVLLLPSALPFFEYHKITFFFYVELQILGHYRCVKHLLLSCLLWSPMKSLRSIAPCMNYHPDGCVTVQLWSTRGRWHSSAGMEEVPGAIKACLLPLQATWVPIPLATLPPVSFLCLFLFSVHCQTQFHLRFNILFNYCNVFLVLKSYY